MKKNPLLRGLAAALCAQLLLGAAAAQQELPWPAPARPAAQWLRDVPNFEAPAATHCTGPVRTREVPGFNPAQPHPGGHWREGAADSGSAAPAETHARSSRPAAPPALADAMAAPPSAPLPPPPPPLLVPAPAGPQARTGVRGFGHDQVPQPPRRPQQPAALNAGVVDDNADFSAYLQFRERTLVDHRWRDVRARHLLEVKDRRGRPVGDAEVAVLAASGHAMWARTDTGGRVWLHPDAFDPLRSEHYQVLVRHGGRQAGVHFSRSGRSAIEVVLDASPPPARARLDLAFLIDATGSMGDEIDKLKASLRSITAQVASLPSQPDICLALVAYRDHGDAFLLRSHDFSHDVGAFLQQALHPLRADGGGDYPEAMNIGLHETVHHLGWRGEGTTRLVILLADAPPHLHTGAPHYDEDMVAALGKGIRIFGVGASGLDSQGEFIQRQIAQYTGGRFVFLTYADPHRPGSGPGRETVHDVQNYSVDTLDRLIVRLITEELAKGGRAGG